jgi:hypothetical protein
MSKAVHHSASSDPVGTVGEARDWLNDEVLPDKASLSASPTGIDHDQVQFGAEWTTMEFADGEPGQVMGG